MNSQLDSFLRKHNMHFDQIDLVKSLRAFESEMSAGLNGNDSSIMMIPTYVGIDGDDQADKSVIVLDAGGTNLRVSTMHFDENGRPVIDSFSKQPMPGTVGTLTSDQFFDEIAGLIAPFDKVSDTVGFCFSFPTEILPNCDGKIINFCKEVEVTGADGKILGENINRSLAKMGCRRKKFVVINDTVASLLGGVVAANGKDYDSFVGFIFGTGLNTCCVEKCSKIGKLPDVNDGSMIINMEPGGFDGFPRGDIDLAFDAGTANCGDHVFEKMVSGAYVGSLICDTVKAAANEGLFSVKTASEIADLDDLSLMEIDKFCAVPKGDCLLASLADNDSDRELLYEIIDAIFERSARMVSVNLAAILDFTGTGKDPNKPVCISAEGTNFYKSVLFRPKLDRYVREFLNQQLGVYCEFVKVEDATIIGTARAALSNA